MHCVWLEQRGASGARGLRETGRAVGPAAQPQLQTSSSSPLAHQLPRASAWAGVWGSVRRAPSPAAPRRSAPLAREPLTARRAATVARISPASRCGGKELSSPGGRGTSGPWVPERTFAKLFSARSCRGDRKEKRAAERGARGGTSAQLRSHGSLNLGEREPQPPGAPSLSQRRRGLSSESGRRRLAAGRPAAGFALSAASGRPAVAGTRVRSRAPRSRCAEERPGSDRDFSKPAARGSGQVRVRAAS